MSDKPEKEEISFDEGTCEVFFAMLLKNMTYFRGVAPQIKARAFVELLPTCQEAFHFWYCLAPATVKYPNIVFSHDLVVRGCSVNLKPLYADDPEALTEALEKLVAFYDKIAALDIAADRDWLEVHARHIMQVGQVAPRIREIADGVSNESLNVEDALVELESLKRETGPTTRTYVNPLDLLDELPEQAAHVRTYIDWFDSYVGGEGMVADEPHTLIMPTSVGKTTLTAQIAAARAEHGQNTLVVITEGGIGPLVSTKVAASLFNVDYKVFGTKASPLLKTNFVKLSETDQLKHRMAQGCVRYMNLVDTGSGTTFEDIVNTYETFVSEGWEPGLIIIDWAGLLGTSLVAQGKFEKLVHALEDVAISCTKFCTKYKIPILITQQVSPAQAQAKGTSPTYTCQDVDECKKWSNHFATAIVSTKFDENDHGTFIFEKVRYGTPNKRVVMKRDGAKCRFYVAKNIEYRSSKYTDATKQSSFTDKRTQGNAAVDGF